MSWEDWGAPKIEMVNAERAGLCRGKNCNGMSCNRAVKRGERVLRIHVASTRGNYTSFFCKKCMPKLLVQMQKVLDDNEPTSFST